MIISLPDSSMVSLDVDSLAFRQTQEPENENETSKTLHSHRADILALSRRMTNPSWRFSDCFRRISDRPRYSPKSSVHEFDVMALCRIYELRGDYQGGTFSSSTSSWHFLDGGMVSHNGYGFGSHSWIVVDGAEALRAVCLFFGIQQPRKIRGETIRRPLATLLEEMTSVPLRKTRGLNWTFPMPGAQKIGKRR